MHMANSSTLLIRPLSLYLSPAVIQVFCRCFTPRLLQKCLPGVALCHRALPVNSCSLTSSLRLHAFKLAPTHSIFHTFSGSSRSVSRSHNKRGACSAVPVTYSLSASLPLCVRAGACIQRSVCCTCWCMWSASPKRVCQTWRHGSGLILMQAHGVELRLGDNCCSEEWMAWELSSCSSASHQAVHHMGLMTDVLRGETKAISGTCAQLMRGHTELT